MSNYRTGAVRALSVALLTATATVHDAANAEVDIGRTLFVANDGIDSDSCGQRTNACRSINQTIANASEGDTILVGPGLYGHLDFNDEVLGDQPGEERAEPGDPCAICIRKRVRISSTHGPHATVILIRRLEAVTIFADGTIFGRRNGGFLIADNRLRVQGARNARVVGNVVHRGAFVFEAERGIIHATGNVAIDSQQSAFSANSVNGAVGYVVLRGNIAFGTFSGPGFVIRGPVPHVVFDNVAILSQGAGMRVENHSTIARNVISSNALGIEIAGPIVGGAHIRENLIVGSRAAGIRFTAGAAGDKHRVVRNNIFGNGITGRVFLEPIAGINCGLLNESSEVVDARNNYWGAASGPGENPADQAGGACDIAGTTLVSPHATNQFDVGKPANAGMSLESSLQGRPSLNGEFRRSESNDRGARVYAANNGIDGDGCGSSQQPCRTINRAMANANEGDTVLVGPGRYGDLNGDQDVADPDEERSIGVDPCDGVCITKRLRIFSTHGALATLIQTLRQRAVGIVADGVVFGRKDGGFSIVTSGPVLVDRAGDVRVTDNIVWRSNAAFFVIADRGPVYMSHNVVSDNSIVGFILSSVEGARGFAVVKNNVALGNGDEGFLIDGPVPHVVSGNSVLRSAKGLLVRNHSSVSRNVITANRTGIEAEGPFVEGVRLRHNSVISNFLAGVRFLPSATGPSHELRANSIFGNARMGALPIDEFEPPQPIVGLNCGLFNESGEVVHARRNYWGSPNGPGPDPADEAGGRCDVSGTTLTAPHLPASIPLPPRHGGDYPWGIQ